MFTRQLSVQTKTTETVQQRVELTVGKNRMMFSTGLSAMSKTRYLQRVDTGQTGSLQHDIWTSVAALRRASAALSVLPKCVREIRLDKIGFDVLADTHDVCYALRLKNWQLDEDKGRRRHEPRDCCCCSAWLEARAVETLPCFSLQQSRDLKTDLVISPENEPKWCVQALQKSVSAFFPLYRWNVQKQWNIFFAILSFTW